MRRKNGYRGLMLLAGVGLAAATWAFPAWAEETREATSAPTKVTRPVSAGAAVAPGKPTSRATSDSKSRLGAGRGEVKATPGGERRQTNTQLGYGLGRQASPADKNSAVRPAPKAEQGNGSRGRWTGGDKPAASPRLPKASPRATAPEGDNSTLPAGRRFRSRPTPTPEDRQVTTPPKRTVAVPRPSSRKPVATVPAVPTTSQPRSEQLARAGQAQADQGTRAVSATRQGKPARAVRDTQQQAPERIGYGAHRRFETQVPPTPRAEIQRSTSWMDGWVNSLRQQNQAARDIKKIDPTTLTVRTPAGERIRLTVFDRDHNRIIVNNFNNISRRLGRPGHGLVYIPRPVNAFDIGYHTGYRDGYRDGRHYGSHHRNRRPVFGYFYSPFYFDDPFFTGFSYPGYHQNIYYYYGWLPRWCNPTSLVTFSYDPYPFSYAYSGPSYYNNSPAVDERGLDRALVDIQQAWLNGDPDRIAYHINRNEKISVYFDNDYSYSLSGDDYYSMTLDALTTVLTDSLELDQPTWINTNEAFVSGRHVFIDPDGASQTVYVSFRLHRYGGNWYIIGVGSSPQPISNNYRDFRDTNNTYYNGG